eukprot:COSAG01_NODE_35118_length_536_cov_11.858124_1_plen_57_part_10
MDSPQLQKWHQTVSIQRAAHVALLYILRDVVRKLFSYKIFSCPEGPFASKHAACVLH